MTLYDNLTANPEGPTSNVNFGQSAQSHLRGIWKSARKRWQRLNNHIALRRAVGDLDDHMLRDIGLDGTDFVAELKRRKELEKIWRNAPL